MLAVGPEKEVWEKFPYAAWEQGFGLAWVHSSEEALEILSRVPMDLLIVDLDCLDLSGPKVILTPPQ